MKLHFLGELLKPGETIYVLSNARTGQVVARHLELAGNSKTRRRGLLGRTSLAPDAAMIIAPCDAIHTFFMKFVIDVVFVNRDGAIVKLYRGLKPWRIGFAFGAFATLEFAAGWIDQSGVRTGDSLLVTA